MALTVTLSDEAERELREAAVRSKTSAELLAARVLETQFAAQATDDLTDAELGVT